MYHAGMWVVLGSGDLEEGSGWGQAIEAGVSRAKRCGEGGGYEIMRTRSCCAAASKQTSGRDKTCRRKGPASQVRTGQGIESASRFRIYLIGDFHKLWLLGWGSIQTAGEVTPCSLSTVYTLGEVADVSRQIYATDQRRWEKIKYIIVHDGCID